jgi:hypothetical protein
MEDPVPASGDTLDSMRRAPFLFFACLAVEASAATFAVGGEVIVGPGFAPYGLAPPPWMIHDSLGPCLAPLNCGEYEQMRRFLERYERNYGGRFAPEKPPPVLPVQPRAVAPTPAAHIQPDYRDASQLRPEFEQRLPSSVSPGRPER